MFADLKSMLCRPNPIRNMPEPSDPMAGLLLSQGQPVLHLCYFMASQLFLTYAKTDSSTGSNMCLFRIGDTNEFEMLPADQLLHDQVVSISWQHFICFMLISVAEQMSAVDLDAHYSVYLNIMSCLLYQTTVIGIYLEQHKYLPMMTNTI